MVTDMYIGKYEVLTQVGSGGMGLVYQARLPETNQVVALKAIHPELVLDPTIQRRFLQEIEILAQLPSHPNLVKLHQVFSEAGNLYLVTDFIAGESLKDRLQAGPLPVETALSVFSQVLSGLEAIHQHGIIHRDIKPSNILLDHHGRAYISDFGIAEQEFNSTQNDDLIFVTAKYAAPEILAPALGATAVKPQIDIYALGMVLYEALVGDPVFRTCFSNVYAGQPESLSQRWLAWHTDVSTAAPAIQTVTPLIPPPLASAIGRMIEKDPARRYRDVRQISLDLTGLLAPGGINNVATTEMYMNPPGDEATIPIGPGGRIGPQPGGPSGGTPFQMNLRQAPPAARRSRRIREKVWWVAGGGLVVGMVVLVLYFLRPPVGFVVELHGLPPGATIGLDQTASPVAIINTGYKTAVELLAGKRLISINHPNYDPCTIQVTGQNGDPLKTLWVRLKPRIPTRVENKGEMVLVPGGEFLMGDQEGLENEKPARWVILEDFYIDRTEVTNAQFKAFCDATNRPYPFYKGGQLEKDTKRYDPLGYFLDNPDSPVIGISWTEAHAYADWAGKRLLTEAEWEKSASWDPGTEFCKPAETCDVKKRKWPWGDVADPTRAVLNTDVPKPVGKTAGDVSAYLVQDLAGNAWEWIGDEYCPVYGGPGNGQKVVRGGAFRFNLTQARTTFRVGENPETKTMVTKVDEIRSPIGFRCATSVKSSSR